MCLSNLTLPTPIQKLDHLAQHQMNHVKRTPSDVIINKQIKISRWRLPQSKETTRGYEGGGLNLES
jgi:hypothetical protein